MAESIYESLGVRTVIDAWGTVTALGGEDLKYYIAVPNYEREYGEGETIVDDFQLDEWMSAGVSVASSEKLYCVLAIQTGRSEKPSAQSEAICFSACGSTFISAPP